MITLAVAQPYSALSRLLAGLMGAAFVWAIITLTCQDPRKRNRLRRIIAGALFLVGIFERQPFVIQVGFFLGLALVTQWCWVRCKTYVTIGHFYTPPVNNAGLSITNWRGRHPYLSRTLCLAAGFCALLAFCILGFLVVAKEGQSGPSKKAMLDSALVKSRADSGGTLQQNPWGDAPVDRLAIEHKRVAWLAGPDGPFFIKRKELMVPMIGLHDVGDEELRYTKLTRYAQTADGSWVMAGCSYLPVPKEFWFAEDDTAK